MGNGGGVGGFITDVMGGGDDYVQNVPQTDLAKYGYGGRTSSSFETDASQAQGRQGAQIDMTAANQSRGMALGTRGQSSEALDMARQAALGQAPSVAQQQLQMGRDQALQNSMAMANSVRGGGANLAAAQMAAQRQQGEMMGQTNQQAAQLRAQEMAQARGQYGSMAAQQRAQDLQSQGLDFQAAQAQAQLEQQQHGLNDAYTMGMYGLGQHAADQQQMGGIRGQEDTAANQLGAGQINAGVNAINAGASSQGGSQALGAMAGMAGAAMMFSDARLKRDVRPIGGDMGGPPEGQTAQQQRLARMQGMMGGGGNDAYSKGLALGANLGAMFSGGGGGDMMGAGARPGRSEADLNANSGRNLGTAEHPVYEDAISGDAVNRIAGPSNMVQSTMMSPEYMGSMYSDARLKSGITPAVSEGTKVNSLYSDAHLKTQAVGGGNDVDRFMGSLHPVSYHYKPGVPGEDPSAARYGILAQDVARTPMGRSLVEQTPIGMGINVPHATGALMAGEGELYARQRHLEQQLARLRGGR
jgi:hypothetical protein